MSLVKWLLPDEWIIKMFPPSEDKEEKINIYLHFIEQDATLQFKENVSRYDVIEFIKQINTDYDTISDNIYDLTTSYFTVPERYSTQKLMSVFQSEQIVFMSTSKIVVEHNKNANGYWITEIYKENSKNKKHLATISNFENIEKNDFTDAEKELLSI